MSEPESPPDPKAPKAPRRLAAPEVPLWTRLRRARVPQVLGIYAGVSFAILQGGDIFLSRLGLPNWTFFGLVFLLLAGAPIVVITAIVQHGERVWEKKRRMGKEAPRSFARLGGIFTWRNAGLWGVGGVTTLGFIVALVMIGPFRTARADMIELAEPVLIAHFGSSTRDEFLADVVTEAFRIDFEQTPLVRVVGPGQIREGLLRMRRAPDETLTPALARELALREGIRVVLLGEVNTTGGGAIISVRLVEADSEESLVSLRESAPDSASVIEAVDRLSSRVRESLGESLGSVRAGESLERVSTSSLAALRKYSLAVRAIDRERDFATGTVLLEEALAEDSTFAMAWRLLSIVGVNQGLPHDEWAPALRRAYELSNRLSDRERYLTTADYYRGIEDNTGRAIIAYRRLLELHPYDITAMNNLGLIYADLGEPRQAIELYRRALDIDSGSPVVHGNLVHQLVFAGDYTGAREAMDGFSEAFPGSPVAEGVRRQLLAAIGAWDEAEEHAEAIVADETVDPMYRLRFATFIVELAILRGRPNEALDRMERILMTPGVERLGATPELRDQVEARLRLRLLADTAGALAAVDRIVRRNGGILPERARDGLHLVLAEIELEAGRLDQGAALLRAWNAAVGDATPTPLLERAGDDLDAYLALLRGDHAYPLDHFRMRTRERPVTPLGHLQLALTHDAMERPDSALVHFEWYLDVPHPDRFTDDVWYLPQVLERTARLRYGAGDVEGAREAALRLLELWKDAEPELEPRLRAMRELAGPA